MSPKPKKKQREMPFWTVMYTHRFGSDSFMVQAHSGERAMSMAVEIVNIGFDGGFEPDRGENIEVAPFVAPDGYKLVRK